MTLHERITAALDGTTPGPWQVSGHGDVVETADGSLVCRDITGDVADLIAAAPSLLTEAARRLDPGGTDVEYVVRVARALARTIGDDRAEPFHAAADLLAQVFLDPQEAT